MAGKTQSKFTRLYVDGYDLSADGNSAEWGLDIPEVAQIGFSDSIQEHLAGVPKASGNVKLWYDDAVGGSYTVLKNPAPRHIVYAYGQQAVPAVGNPVVAGRFLQKKFTVDIALAGALGITIPFPSFDSGARLLNNIYGYLLHANAQETATFSGATVDCLSSSAWGGVGYLQVLVAGGVWSLIIEHSANGSSWATLLTFTANGSAITAEQKAVSGTVNRYLRASGTRTSGNVNLVAAFVRGLAA